eukprot:scaffold128017_cov51-Phaeocystis_antarctica.AAC.1
MPAPRRAGFPHRGHASHGRPTHRHVSFREWQWVLHSHPPAINGQSRATVSHKRKALGQGVDSRPPKVRLL